MVDRRALPDTEADAELLLDHSIETDRDPISPFRTVALR